MGKKEKELANILTMNGIIKLNSRSIRSFTKDLLYGIKKDEIFRVYKQLGGIDEEYKYRGRCDIIAEDYIIELDEQLHFNDYRLMTLGSPLYNEIKKFPLEIYRNYCIRYKENCLKSGSYGGKWSNGSCEKMFALAQREGDLNGNGSPRWKQRAFYDFIKDISYTITNLPVVRLSIYDVIDYGDNKHTLGDILESDFILNHDVVDGIQQLINHRL